MKHLKDKNYLWLVGIGTIFYALIFYGLHINKFIYSSEYIPSDSYSYIEAANMLFDNFSAHPLRPLGYAFILGLPQLFSDSIHLSGFIAYSLVVNFVIWISTILLLYKTMRLFMGSKFSFGGTLVFIFCVGNALQINFILTETIMTFLLLLAVHYSVKYSLEKKVEFLILATSILNLSILFRPGMLYFSFLVTVGVIIYLLYTKSVRYLANISFLSAFFLVAIQFFCIYFTYGDFTPSYIGNTTWYNYLGGEANAKKSQISYMQERENRLNNLKGLDWHEKSVVCKKDLKLQIKTNFNNVLFEYLSNIQENILGGNSYGIKRIENVSNGVYVTRFNSFLMSVSVITNRYSAILTIFTIILSLYQFRKAPISLVISLGIVLYIIFTSGISFWQGARFHMVFYPLVIVNLFHALALEPKIKCWLNQ